MDHRVMRGSRRACVYPLRSTRARRAAPLAVVRNQRRPSAPSLRKLEQLCARPLLRPSAEVCVF